MPNADAAPVWGPAPGPRGRPVVGLLPELRRDALDLFTRLARDYGPVVNIPGPRKAFLIADPDAAEQILCNKGARFVKGPEGAQLAHLIGRGLLNSDGELWASQRRIVQPSFGAQRLSLLLTLVTREVDEYLSGLESKLPESGAIDMDPEINFLTLRIITRCLLGTDIPIGFDIHHATVTALDEITHRVNSVFALPLYVPTPRNLKLKRALAAMNEFIYAMIAARRAKPSNGVDLLSVLLRANDEEDGRRMTDKQLRDELATFVVAGHETTANAIIWILYVLSQHPEAVSGIRREINAKRSQAATISELFDFTYLAMVIKESLRLYPPAWVILRKNLVDEYFGGYHIPKGSLNVLCTYLLHRQKNLWEDPELFCPERFLPEEHAKRHPYCYVPFGGGGRTCIGRNFALLQITAFFVRFVERFTVKLAPGFTPHPLANITLRSANGMKLVFEKASRERSRPGEP